MSVFSGFFPLGLGTSRLPVSGPNDAEGLEQSVEIVLRALELGVNYVDVGHNYSAGMAPRVLKEAFRRTKRPFSTMVKVQYGEDRTADDALRRAELHLTAMGLERARFFTCWSIWSWEDFQRIMEPGGIYEGAVKLKAEGVVEHICASLHAPPADMIRMIESGAFEGVTVSYSLLNAAQMRPVLDAAKARNVGVAVMNPLGGGLIAQNRAVFSFACCEPDGGDAVHAALRFAKAHPAVDIVLGGVSSTEELEDSAALFSAPDAEPPEARMERALSSLSGIQGFCTGCKYCAGCPKGIPTYALMKARNALLFDPAASYNRQGPEELLYDLQIFRKLYYEAGWLPASGENPCVRCGKCERACTQKLDVIEGVSEIYRRAEQAGYTEAAHKARLEELLVGKGCRKVGLYPSGGFSRLVIRLYREFFGEPAFEWVLFNSDEKTWGRTDEGHVIHAPQEIGELCPDMILVCTYRFEEEIARSLRPYAEQGILIEKLHRKGEVPWVF